MEEYKEAGFDIREEHKRIIAGCLNSAIEAHKKNNFKELFTQLRTIRFQIGHKLNDDKLKDTESKEKEVAESLGKSFHMIDDSLNEYTTKIKERMRGGDTNERNREHNKEIKTEQRELVEEYYKMIMNYLDEMGFLYSGSNKEDNE